MKSTEFITESNLSDIEVAILNKYKIPAELVEVLGAIKQECQPYLAQVDDPVTLYRGIERHLGWYVHKNVRLEHRDPMSSSLRLHNGLNDAFSEKFGAEFRNALFCTGKKAQAGVYGTPYIIFPAGNFTFIWSDQVRDLYHYYENVVYDETNHINDAQAFLNNFDPNIYTNKGLQDAIYSGNEIMIRCRSFYGINYNTLHSGIISQPRAVLQGIREYLAV